MTDAPQWLRDFVVESNLIENIHGVSSADIDAHLTLLELSYVGVEDLALFVRSVAGDHHSLREAVGQDVRVGFYLPPPGGPEIRRKLVDILNTKVGECLPLHVDTPFDNHLRYECLHPFTDGNGRSGRALWLWQMLNSGMFERENATKRTFLSIFMTQAAVQGFSSFAAHRQFYFDTLAEEHPQ